MTLPASFPLSMSQVNTELGRATNATTSLLESATRTLAQKASGAVAFSDLLGKATFTASGVNSNISYSSSANGNADSFPSVNRSGGQSPYTYSWSFTSNPGAATLLNATLQTATVRKAFLAGSTGAYSATLQCVVTDNLGNTKTVTGVTAAADWAP